MSTLINAEYIQLDELGSNPSTPGTGTARLYVRNDNSINVIFDSGSTVNLGAAGVTQLDDLSDVTLSGQATGDILLYDGADYLNTPHTLTNINDVTITVPSNGEALLYNSGTWENGTVASTVDGLTDTNITSITDNDILTWDNGTGRWINEQPVGGGGALNDLTDVTITTPAAEEGLIYTGSAWVNKPFNKVFHQEVTDMYLEASIETIIRPNSGMGISSPSWFLNGMSASNNISADNTFTMPTFAAVRYTLRLEFDASPYGIDQRGPYDISYLTDGIGDNMAAPTSVKIAQFDTTDYEAVTITWVKMLNGVTLESTFSITNNIGQDSSVDMDITIEILDIE